MFGAVPTDGGFVEFEVWAPRAESVSVLGAKLDPSAQEEGVFHGRIAAGPGTEYRFVLDGRREWPDPCSRCQPHGMLGPSCVIDPAELAIRDGPQIELKRLVLYELHVGAFSAEGTFDGVRRRLDELAEAGVTAIELMPVATFPGSRGWGYDGLFISAPHPAYGGPRGLARLVDAAHAAGLGVVLDVVYNHLGPGGEALEAFGPYLRPSTETLWGKAIDFGRRPVREWAIQNAEMWLRDYKIDGLRLDATHAVHDESEVHVFRELADRARRIHPGALLVSEMEIGDMRPLDEWTHDAQWEDSLHHALHALLTGEREGYYARYGRIEDLQEALESSRPGFVGCAQNHDQVGNRPFGDRLPPALDRVALSAVLFSRSTPLIFMGEEYGETRPFQFFTDHIDPAIVKATQEGRRREFADWKAFADGDIPDPQALSTFEASKLEPRRPAPWFREALRLRHQLPDELETRVLDDHRLSVRRGDYELVLDFQAITAEIRRRDFGV